MLYFRTYTYRLTSVLLLTSWLEQRGWLLSTDSIMYTQSVTIDQVTTGAKALVWGIFLGRNPNILFGLKVDRCNIVRYISPSS